MNHRHQKYRVSQAQSASRFTRNVVPGIHRLQHSFVNCYLVEDADGVTVVDTAFPGTWPLVHRALRAIGRTPRDVRAVLLTHAHFDHLGFALAAQQEWSVPIFAHPEEHYIARHPYRYAHEKSRLMYPIRYPAAVPILGRMALAGALRVDGVSELGTLEPGSRLDVPGKPRVIFAAGHTAGHCAFFYEEQRTILTGDAIVTLDPYTGREGPQIVSGAATANSDLALGSLSALEETGAVIVLPGHGQPWRAGIEAAAHLAREAGAS